MKIDKIINEELEKLINSISSLKENHLDYYNSIREDYTSKAKEIGVELSENNSLKKYDENEIKIYIRKLFFEKRKEEINFFTITSKDDFVEFPSKNLDFEWGNSLLYTPLNEHSRKFMSKGDIVFCYRIGQFGDLNEALNTRGIYGIGVVMSNPVELFTEYNDHKRWGVEIGFPLKLEQHLKLRDIQMHPQTINLTPYNGNRNDALQHIPNEEHYENLLNLVISQNFILKKYFNIFFNSVNIKTLDLPSNILNHYYKGNEVNVFKSNLILDRFIIWVNKAENYKASYQGLLQKPLIQAWNIIYFKGKLFHIDPLNPLVSYKKIENMILDSTNEEWVQFRESNHGCPRAILGKKNYLKFLGEFISETNNLLELKDNTPDNELNIEIRNEIGIDDQYDKIKNDSEISAKVEYNKIDDKISHNLILYGAPGTGKSYEMNNRIERFFNNEWLYTRVTFHSNYSYQNFVGSYKPKPIYTENGRTVYNSDRITKHLHQKEPMIEYSYEPGPFIKMFERAIKFPNHNFLILIEELNRANSASVFGDIFQLLDRNELGESEYAIDANTALIDYLRSNDINQNQIRIPSNLYIWATMNNADQGVLPLDTAFKRRWNFEHISLNEKENKREDTFINLPFLKDRQLKWNKFRDVLNKELIDLGIHEDKLIGPFFMSENEINNPEKIKNKLLLYLKEDILRYRSGVFKDSLSTFTMISDEYDKGNSVFHEKLKWFD